MDFGVWGTVTTFSKPAVVSAFGWRAEAGQKPNTKTLHRRRLGLQGLEFRVLGFRALGFRV